MTTPCGHNICLGCLNRSFKAKEFRCPSCRCHFSTSITVTQAACQWFVVESRPTDLRSIWVPFPTSPCFVLFCFATSSTYPFFHHPKHRLHSLYMISLIFIGKTFSNVLSFSSGPSWLRTMQSRSTKSYEKHSSKCSLGMRLGGKVSWQENMAVNKLVDNL